MCDSGLPSTRRGSARQFFRSNRGWPVYYVMAVTRGKSRTLCDLRAVAQAAVLLDGRLDTCSDVRAVCVWVRVPPTPVMRKQARTLGRCCELLGVRQKTPCNVRSDGAATTHGPWFRRGKLCSCVRGSAGREAGEWFGSKCAACLESPARDEIFMNRGSLVQLLSSSPVSAGK